MSATTGPAPQSAAAPSPFPPIADYAFLSDCHTSALVAPDGSIDWLCVPRFDSPSVFGSLLDRQAGSFRVGPFGINVPTARIYEPGTNVLATTWKTPTGWVLVRDALTMGPQHGEDLITPHTRPPVDDDADHMLVRTVLCLDGNLELELVCEPDFDYGRAPADWSLIGDDRHTADARAGELTVRLQTDLALGIEGDRVRARHRLEQGDQAYCALSWAEGHAVPQDVDEANARLEATVRYWRRWLGRARLPDHRWRDPIQRSALTIKGLTYMPTGATVAAATTSLPETPGGERNWDYRFTWIRDSTFTLQALHFLNLDWEADEFMQFVADLEPNEDGALQIMYGIDGRRDLTESVRDELSGYAGAHPVRLGNGAFDQRQNDVFGAALDSILLHARRSQRLPRRLWPIVEAQARCATERVAPAGPGHLGGPRRASALRLVQADVLGRARPRGQARGDPRRSGAAGHLARPQPTRSRRTSSSTACATTSCASTTTRKRWTRPPCSRRSSASCRRRRASAQERRGDRRRPDRGRVRAPLSHRRDRRRAVGEGGELSDLLVLARVGPGDRRATSSVPAT